MFRKSGFVIFSAIVFALPFGSVNALAQSRSNEDRITPLMRAARDGEEAAFAKALKRTPDVNAQDVYGWTALTYAVVRGEEDMATSLLSKRADVNVMDEDGRSPLMHAVDYKRGSIVKLLIERHADVNCRDKKGATAIGLAWAKAYDDIVELLKRAGADELKPEDKRAELYSGVPAYSPSLLQDSMMPAKTLPLLGRGNYHFKMLVLVGADGAVQKIRVLIGLPDGFTDKIVANEYKSRYSPATKNGQPIAVWTTREIGIRAR
jgi:hypothetical protein